MVPQIKGLKYLGVKPFSLKKELKRIKLLAEEYGWKITTK